MKTIGLNSLPSVKGHILNLTVNLAFVAIFYIFLGAVVSYVLRKLTLPFDAEWKALPNSVQVADVAIESTAIVLLAFWLTYVVQALTPIVPVSRALETYLDSFGGRIVFLYAVFLFLEPLDDKLRHVFQDIFGTIQ